MQGVQALVGLVGQRERVAAGDEQAAHPGAADPGGQERRQLRISDPMARPVDSVGVGEVVLEVVQQQQHRLAAQQLLSEQPQAVLPPQVGVAEHGDGAAQRVGLVPAAFQTNRQQPAGELVEDLLDGERARQRHDQAGLLAQVSDELGGQAALADPPDPVHDHPGALTVEGAAEQSLLAAAAHEVTHPADHHRRVQRRLRRRGDLLEPIGGVKQRQRRPPDEQRRGGPLSQRGQTRLPRPVGCRA